MTQLYYSYTVCTLLMKIKQMIIQTGICKIVIMLYMRFTTRMESFFIFNDKEWNMKSSIKKNIIGKIRCFQCVNVDLFHLRNPID